MSAIVKSKPIRWFYVVPRATTPCFAVPIRRGFYTDPARIKEILDLLSPEGTMHEIEYSSRQQALIDNPITQMYGKGMLRLDQLKMCLGLFQ